jgi:phosphoglycolate phosphatase-like HAD superfamily hydrolase
MTDPKLSFVHALIFDLDSTLIDSKQDLIRSVSAMLRELGRGELEAISGYIGHGAPQLVARARFDGRGTATGAAIFSGLLRAVQNGHDVRVSRPSRDA